MKKTTLIMLILLTLIASALWFLGSWWYYTKLKCGCNDAPSKATIADTSITGTKKSTKLTEQIPAIDQAAIPVTPVEPNPTVDLATLDSDTDGISDADEKRIGTNPQKADTDGDGIADNEELGADLSAPIDSDKDGIIDALDDDDDNDGLSTLLEGKIGTSPLLKDTDGDGISDLKEAGIKLDDPEHIEALDTDKDGTIDALDIDDDDDGLDTATEILLGTNSLLADSDGDGLSDAKEIGELTGQPKDSDADGIIDALDSEDNTDTDNDGITDQQEKKIGTNAEKADSDDDGIDDSEEIGSNINQPLDTDNNGIINALDADDDGDTLPTKLESTLGTNPLSSDSDGDGIDDATEIGKNTLTPLDSDNDGIIDALDKDPVDVAEETPTTDTAAKETVLAKDDASADNSATAENETPAVKEPTAETTDQVTAEVISPAKGKLPAAMRLYFPFNSKKPETSEDVSRYFMAIATWTQADPKHTITLTGHTDNIGSEKANLALGLRRVMVIRELLIDAGVPFQQIDVISRGESQPLVDNTTKEGRLKNRRVEIIPVSTENKDTSE
jgi:outer membrane protein OmpA-like peptidoglycan-associated protein